MHLFRIQLTRHDTLCSSCLILYCWASVEWNWQGWKPVSHGTRDKTVLGWSFGIAGRGRKRFLSSYDLVWPSGIVEPCKKWQIWQTVWHIYITLSIFKSCSDQNVVNYFCTIQCRSLLPKWVLRLLCLQCDVVCLPVIKTGTYLAVNCELCQEFI